MLGGPFGLRTWITWTMSRAHQTWQFLLLSAGFREDASITWSVSPGKALALGLDWHLTDLRREKEEDTSYESCLSV